MSVKVFGNGSLINRLSLISTCPGGKILRPAFVKGWRRHLNTSLIGSPRTIDGVAPTAMNVDEGTFEDWLNGVLIELSYEDMYNLRVREAFYNTRKIQVFDYESKKPLGDALMWIVVDYPKAPTPWDHPRTLSYIKICLEGCVQFGQKFVDDFLNTTYADDKKIIEYTQVTDILDQIKKST